MKLIKCMCTIVLTLIVIPIMMIFIFFASVNSTISKKNIDKIINEINVSDFLIDEDGNYNEIGLKIKEELVKNGLPEEVIIEFINSKVITEFASKYIISIKEYVIDGKVGNSINSNDIAELLTNNVDNIVEDLRTKKVDGYALLTDEMVEEFKSNINEISEHIDEALPNIKDFDVAFNIDIGIKIMYGGFIIVMIAFLALIFWLNIKNHSFLKWYGLIFIVSSLPFVILTSFARVIVSQTNLDAFVKLAIVITNKLKLYSSLTIIMGVLCIVISFISAAIEKSNES